MLLAYLIQALAVTASVAAVYFAYAVGKRHNSHLLINEIVDDLKQEVDKKKSIDKNIKRIDRLQSIASVTRNVLILVVITILAVLYFDYKLKLNHVIHIAQPAIKLAIAVSGLVLACVAVNLYLRKQLMRQLARLRESSSQANQLLQMLIDEFGADMRDAIFSHVELDLSNRNQQLSSMIETQTQSLGRITAKSKKIDHIHSFYCSVKDRMAATMGKPGVRGEITEEYALSLKKYFLMLEDVGNEVRNNKELEEEVSVEGLTASESESDEATDMPKVIVDVNEHDVDEAVKTIN